jgi:hypothetical protein
MASESTIDLLVDYAAATRGCAVDAPVAAVVYDAV